MNWMEYWSDHNISGIFWERNIELYCNNITQQIRLSKEFNILDYGSGTGYAAKYLSPRVNLIHLLEPSEILLEKSKVINKNNSNIVYHLLKDINDIEHIFGKDMFHIILVNSVMQYIPPEEIQKLLTVFNHILKNNGKIIISDIVSNNFLLVKDIFSYLLCCRNMTTLIDFLKFSMIEFKKIAIRSRLKFWTYSKEELEELFPADYALSWIDNPTALSSRMCAILSKNGMSL